MIRLITLLVVTLFVSCSPMRVTPSLSSGECVRKASSTFIIRYGDDRFHDDDQLIDEIYLIYGTDTVYVCSKQRVRNSNPVKYQE